MVGFVGDWLLLAPMLRKIHRKHNFVPKGDVRKALGGPRLLGKLQ